MLARQQMLSPAAGPTSLLSPVAEPESNLTVDRLIRPPSHLLQVDGGWFELEVGPPALLPVLHPCRALEELVTFCRRSGVELDGGRTRRWSVQAGQTLARSRVFTSRTHSPFKPLRSTSLPGYPSKHDRELLPAVNAHYALCGSLWMPACDVAL